jgi:hypothetical protein
MKNMTTGSEISTPLTITKTVQTNSTTRIGFRNGTFGDPEVGEVVDFAREESVGEGLKTAGWSRTETEAVEGAG